MLRIARAVPELRIVIDHLGRPPVDCGRWEPWASQIAALARCPGVAVKVSVGIDLLTTWLWDVEGLARYVRLGGRPLRSRPDDAGQ